MREVLVAADVIVSPLGRDTKENFEKIQSGITGISFINDPALSAVQISAGKINSIQKTSDVTRFEAMAIEAIEKITNRFSLNSERTLFILSTTKGNIDLLSEQKENHPRLHLHSTAEFLAGKAGVRRSLVVSNACISGVMALIIAKRFLQSEKFDHALIVGVDELTRFVVSGFQSLAALSNNPCKPFDADRKGINLGEAASAMLLTSKPESLGVKPYAKISGAGLSNDANHISGPSRTGEELCSAILQALNESQCRKDEIDFISAHGTATLYNDEMEAKAFNLAGMGRTPVNSLKGYYGHTLGAAGVVETVIGIHSLLNNELVSTHGFEKPGVSQPVNVIDKKIKRPVKTFIKTASGFGGCNAAIVVQKVN